MPQKKIVIGYLLFSIVLLGATIVSGNTIQDKAPVPWKTVKVGTYKSNEELFKALLKGGFSVNKGVREVIEEIKLASKPTDLKLVAITPFGLGLLNDFSPLKEVYAEAERQGYKLCPAEVGPQLRLQWPYQTYEEPGRDTTSYWVAMEPVKDPTTGRFVTFYLYTDVCVRESRPHRKDGRGLFIESVPKNPEFVGPFFQLIFLDK